MRWPLRASGGAARAIAEGGFKTQVAPVEIASRKGTVVCDTDEHVRAYVTAEQLAKMKPSFNNDAFASQACAETRAPDLDPATVNPNGSGISLGHPVETLACATSGRIDAVRQRAGAVPRGRGRADHVQACADGNVEAG